MLQSAIPRAVNTMQLIDYISLCKQHLSRQQLSVEMASDMNRAKRLIVESRLPSNDAAKPYLTDFLNPDVFTYTSGNCLWIFLKNSDDQIVGTVAFRCDQLRDRSLRTLHEEILRYKYPDEAHLEIPHRRLPPVADRITGNVVFVAELWMDGKHAGPKRINTVYFAQLALSSVLCQWQSIDHIYGFVRKRDALLGAVHRYGFPHAYPGTLSYSSPISAPPGDLFFIHADREDLMDMILHRTAFSVETCRGAGNGIKLVSSS